MGHQDLWTGQERFWCKRPGTAETATTLFMVGFILFTYAGTVFPHALGNNTVNRQAGLHITSEQLELVYIVDMAEIPTLSESQEADLDQDGETSEEEWNTYARRWAEEVVPYLRLELNDQRLSLKLENQYWSLQLGAAGLNILRLEARFSALLTGYGERALLQYRDDHKPDQLGWKEVWISVKNGARITQTTVAQTDRSRGLTEFTLPVGTSPPNELTARAHIVFEPVTALYYTAQPSVIQPKSSMPTRATPIPMKPKSAKPLEADAQAPPGSLNPLQTGGSDTAIRRVPHLDGPVVPAISAKAVPVSWSQQAWPFFKLGMHHIATGWDHLMFLLGLLLLRQPILQLIKVVSAFTIAHSITLGLAANGLITPPGSWIEPGIALTIAYVGILSLVWQHSRHGIWLAFGFGLVHGFGFAGALAETLEGQPSSHGNWLVSLASFNLGIEAVQVLLVAVLVPLMLFATRYSWYGLAQKVASFVVFSAGLGWFLSRTVGLLL